MQRGLAITLGTPLIIAGVAWTWIGRVPAQPATETFFTTTIDLGVHSVIEGPIPFRRRIAGTARLESLVAVPQCGCTRVTAEREGDGTWSLRGSLAPRASSGRLDTVIHLVSAPGVPRGQVELRAVFTSVVTLSPAFCEVPSDDRPAVVRVEGAADVLDTLTVRRSQGRVSVEQARTSPTLVTITIRRSPDAVREDIRNFSLTLEGATAEGHRWTESLAGAIAGPPASAGRWAPRPAEFLRGTSPTSRRVIVFRGSESAAAALLSLTGHEPRPGVTLTARRVTSSQTAVDVRLDGAALPHGVDRFEIDLRGRCSAELPPLEVKCTW